MGWQTKPKESTQATGQHQYYQSKLAPLARNQTTFVPFRVRVHTITLSVHLNDPFWLQTQTGTRIQRAVLPTSAQ